MKPAAKLLPGIYLIVVLLDLLFIYFNQDEFRWVSKPFLMPLLMLFFFLAAKRKNGKLFYLILAALFLSWCGDLLLQAKNMFIPGLLSFLVAHACYIIYLRQVGKNKKGFLQRKPLFIIPVLLYVVLLLMLLFPYLDELKIPVIIYSMTIGAMLLMAINTRQQLNHTASFFFITGALLFVISDSLLAINLFVVQHWMMSVGVMASYAAAQFFIVKGALMSY